MDQLTEQDRRIELRERVRVANRYLAGAARRAGVQNCAFFQDAGYRGLYTMGVAEIKARKRIAPQEQLLDRAGRVELAANEFRITQTEQKINRESIHGESHATSAHYDVGTEVRATTAKIGGTMPENLPAETSIRKLKSRRKGRSNEMLP